MKEIDLTINNYFRNPLRWRKVPINYNEPLKAFGLKLIYGHSLLSAGKFQKKFLIIIYYGSKFKGFEI
jgi:hypothetical protein